MSTTTSATRSNIFWLTIDQIEVETGFNRRKDFGNLDEFGDSLIANGILQPIHVVKVKGEDKYILRNGERRVRALRLKQEQGVDISEFRIPAISRAFMAEDQALLLQLLTNEGKPFTMLEEANVYEGLFNFGWTPDEIKLKVGKSITHVTNLLILAQGSSKKLKETIQKGTISATLAVQQLKAGKTSEEILNQVDAVVESQSNDGKEIKKVTAKNIDPNKPKDKKISLLDMKNRIEEFASVNDVNEEKFSALKAFVDYYAGDITLNELYVVMQS